jgi:hypothetical protein
MTPFSRFAVAVALLTLIGTACKDSNRAAPPATAASATNRTIVFTAHDFAFTGVPQRMPAGWLTLRMVNSGRELHMFGISRVRDGHTVKEVIDSLTHHREAPTEEWGGPNAVSSGDTSTAGLFFPPGQYLVGCVIEGADGQLHFMKGMTAGFEVVPASDTASVVGEDALVTLTDYHVAVTGAPLTPGARTVRVRNAATQGHDLEILQLLPGHSVEEALRWFEHPAKEPPTARALGGVVAIHPGQEALVTASFAPGRYLFLCWVPDATGQPHFRRGMQTVVTIPRVN